MKKIELLKNIAQELPVGSNDGQFVYIGDGKIKNIKSLPITDEERDAKINELIFAVNNLNDNRQK